MSEEKIKISKVELIALANEQLKGHDDYIDGMEVREVVEQYGVISFRGESFLDEKGMPTTSSTQAFNLYKWLCHHFSKQYELRD